MNRNRYKPKTAADIVQRLPLHRSLDESQAGLVTITPAWRDWLSTAVSNNEISSKSADTFQLVAWRTSPKATNRDQISGKLVINCLDSTSATLLKQRQSSIIEQLNNRLRERRKPHVIEALVIRLSLGTAELQLNVTPKDVTNHHPTTLNEASYGVINRAISACEKQTTNEKLAKSLSNLASTLSGLKSD